MDPASLLRTFRHVCPNAPPSDNALVEFFVQFGCVADEDGLDRIVPLTSGEGTVSCSVTFREMQSAIEDYIDEVVPIILDVLSVCPLDQRKQLAGSLLVIGGVAMIPGLRELLMERIRNLLPGHASTRRLTGDHVNWDGVIISN